MANRVCKDNHLATVGIRVQVLTYVTSETLHQIRDFVFNMLQSLSKLSRRHRTMAMQFGHRNLIMVPQENCIEMIQIGLVNRKTKKIKSEIFSPGIDSSFEYTQRHRYINFENLTLPFIKQYIFNPVQQCTVLFDSVYDHIPQTDATYQEVYSLQSKLVTLTGYNPQWYGFVHRDTCHATRIVTKEMIDYAEKNKYSCGIPPISSSIYLTSDFNIKQTKSLYDIFKLNYLRHVTMKQINDQLTSKERITLNLPIYQLKCIVCINSIGYTSYFYITSN